MYKLIHAIGALLLSCLPAIGAAAVTDLTPSQMRSDLDALSSGIKRYHVRPFARIPESEFDRMVNDLKARTDQLTYPEFLVGMMRIGASLGEGHTGVMPAFDRQLDLPVLPLELWPVSDGYAILAAVPEHADLVGSLLTHIEGVPMNQIETALTPLYSRDSEAAVRKGVAALARVPLLLQGAGILRETLPTYRITVQSPAGDRTLSLAPISRFGQASPLANPVLAGVNANGDPPLWLRNGRQRWWRTVLEDQATLYFDFNSADTGADTTYTRESFERFIENMVEEVQDNPRIRRLVIDLRQNSGGSYANTRGLLGAILRMNRFNERGQLFVLTSETSFSAALNHLSALENFLDPIIVGVAGAGRPGHGAELGRFRLPNSQAEVRVSTVATPDSREHRPAFHPHLYVPFSSADLRQGRDPALEAILAFNPDRSLESELDHALGAGGAEAALARYRSLRETSRAAYIFEEAVLNAIGLRLLEQNRAQEALLLFQQNAEDYPYSPNVYDSLAKAHRALGQTREALANFNHAITLDKRYMYALPIVLELERSLEQPVQVGQQ